MKYWDDAVAEHKQFENMYTVGMRGIGDYAMVGVSNAEQTKNVLTQVITAQRDMLTRNYGKPAATIPQVFTPYKEVLAAYHSGLKLPDDITLTWPDDNFGYVRHLPDAAERGARRRQRGSTITSPIGAARPLISGSRPCIRR